MGEYMKAQVEAGVQVIQIFDSWAGALSSADYREFVLPHTRTIFDAIRGTGVPTIHFGTGTANILQDLREAGGDVIGADWRIPLDEAWDRIGPDRAIQGNLDPTLLLAPLDRMLAGADDVLERAWRTSGTHLQSRPRHSALDPCRSRAGARATCAPVPPCARVTDDVDVAVVGAGVSGLSAAYELRKRKRSVIVLERDMRPGGIILTERVGEFIIDAGPDSLLVQKPAAVALCNELGLGDRLFPTKLPRTAFVLRDGELHPLPAASILGFPTRLGPLVKSTLFRTSAKFRMAAEVMIPRAREAGDESIAGFVRRRFGSEAVTYIAEPLLAGIHAGDVERLSMRALFPRLIDAEARAGSVIRAFRREQGPFNADGVFRSFPNGLAELIDGLMRAVPKESVRFGSNVTRIEERDGFIVHIAGQAPIRARAVILAIPAFAAADLLRPIDTALSDACASIRYLSTATVVFAFPRSAVGHDLQGTGFVVPSAEGLSITAGAWISSKWPHRAPDRTSPAPRLSRWRARSGRAGQNRCRARRAPRSPT